MYDVVEKTWTFPAGERGVRVKLPDRVNSSNRLHKESSIILECNFRGSDDIIDLMLSVDAVRRTYGSDVNIALHIPYFPYARQDRQMVPGESHSLAVIAKLINSLNLARVWVIDPHSDVVEALVDNLIITRQHDAVEVTVPDIQKYDYFISPDAGALKKIYQSAKKFSKPVICAHKIRDISTGDIKGISISESDFESLVGKSALVIDDICDGGKTFIELRKVLPSTLDVDLYVTHGIFSQGMDKLNQAYRNIYCRNNMSTK